MSIAGGISAGAVYGNKGNDSLVVFANASKATVLGGSGNDSVTISGAATSLDL